MTRCWWLYYAIASRLQAAQPAIDLRFPAVAMVRSVAFLNRIENINDRLRRALHQLVGRVFCCSVSLCIGGKAKRHETVFIVNTKLAYVVTTNLVVPYTTC